MYAWMYVRMICSERNAFWCGRNLLMYVDIRLCEFVYENMGIWVHRDWLVRPKCLVYVTLAFNNNKMSVCLVGDCHFAWHWWCVWVWLMKWTWVHFAFAITFFACPSPAMVELGSWWQAVWNDVLRMWNAFSHFVQWKGEFMRNARLLDGDSLIIMVATIVAHGVLRWYYFSVRSHFSAREFICGFVTT